MNSFGGKAKNAKAEVSFDGKEEKSETNSTMSYKKGSVVSGKDSEVSTSKEFENATNCHVCTARFDNIFYRKHHW